MIGAGQRKNLIIWILESILSKNILQKKLSVCVRLIRILNKCFRSSTKIWGIIAIFLNNFTSEVMIRVVCEIFFDRIRKFLMTSDKIDILLLLYFYKHEISILYKVNNNRRIRTQI